MKIHRTENAVKNVVSGVALMMYQMAFPFVLRTVMIYTLGMEYLGLSSLFTSVFQVLNLAELGVGSAMVYSMYKPIAHDNYKKICALMRLYKIYYRIIGIVVLCLGIGLSPFIGNLISGDVPDGVSVLALYFLNLSATVLSYWLFAYKNSLLFAHQRTDIVNKVRLGTFTFQYICQLISLLVFKNFYLYVLSTLATQALTNIVTAIVASKMYPQLDAKGNLPKDERKEINNHVKDVFTAKIGGVVTNSADTVVISAFLGLTTLAVYNNYYFIIFSIIGTMTVIFNACLAGIGNSLVEETALKNYRDFKKFTLLLVWIISFCTVCLYCLFQPFMKIWVHEERMLDNSFVILFCVYFFVYEITQIWATYKDAGGIWHTDRFRPLCVTIVNLTMNLILINIIGLYGILLSTVISYVFVGMPWMLHNIFSCLFKVKAWTYLKSVAYYIFSVVLTCIVCDRIISFILLDNITGLLVKAAVVCITSNFLFVLLYHRLQEFGEVMEIVQRMKKKILKGVVK